MPLHQLICHRVLQQSLYGGMKSAPGEQKRYPVQTAQLRSFRQQSGQVVQILVVDPSLHVSTVIRQVKNDSVEFIEIANEVLY
jgi:hypothetical protein